MFFPPIRTDGRANPLSPAYDAAYAFSDAVLPVRAETAPEPAYVPVCGKTGRPMTREDGCLTCACWSSR